MSQIRLLWWMLEKDLKLFWRDRRTFLLVLLAPVVIMLILANIFNVPDTKQSIKGVTIGVCNLDEKSFDLENDVFQMMLIQGDCRQQAQELVRKGELRISVIIPPHFFTDIQEGKGATLETYVDNAKGQIALVASASMKGYVADLNEEVGTAFILTAWSALSDLNVNLKELVAQIDTGLRLTQEAQRRTEQLKINLSAINSTQVRLQLRDMQDMLQSTHKQIERALFLLSLSSAFPTMNTTPLQELMAQQCADANSSFSNLSLQVRNQTCGQLNASLAFIGESSLAASLNNSSLARTHLQETLSRIERMQELNTQLISAYEALDSLRSDSKDEVIRFNDLMDDYVRQMTRLRNDLSKTTVILDDYTSRDPKNIIRAISLKEHNAFEEKKVLEFMMPGIIALILLFVTMFISSSVIVGERRSGTMARNFLSPISVVFFLMEKSLYLISLAWVQILSMWIVSIILGVPIRWSWQLVLVMCLISGSFVSLGILIGALSKTENTALLTSLVIGLPMLFLSGLFFPFEIMPNIMRTIGGYLPLTLSTQHLERLLTYGLSIDPKSFLILLALSLTMFAIATVLIRAKPMVD